MVGRAFLSVGGVLGWAAPNHFVWSFSSSDFGSFSNIINASNGSFIDDDCLCSIKRF